MPLAVAGLMLATEHPARAGALVVVAILAAILVIAGVPVGRMIERAAEVLVMAIGHVLLLALHLVIVLPVWACRRILPGDGRIGSPGWHLPGSSSAGAPYALDAGRHPRRVRTSIAVGVGTLVLLLTFDYGIGWAWDRQTTDPPEPSMQVAQRDQGATSSNETEAGPVDPRAAEPAMASSPWAAAYFRDLGNQPFTSWPLTGTRPNDFASPHINVTDWARRTWTPRGGGDRPVIWAFGGSGLFGEGQRDEHTIVSELSRLAAADGLPVTARNYGQRGWVHWQEMLLFEQRLAQLDAPDLAVFYDGPNEIDAAAVYGDGVPMSLADIGKPATTSRLSTQVMLPPSTDASLPSQLWNEYTEHSALRKLGRWAGVVADPAGAQEPAPGSEAGSDRQPLEPRDFQTTELAQVAIDTYQRGRTLTDFLGRTHDVSVRHFLQPQLFAEQPTWTYIQRRWPKPTTDLTDSVADRRWEVFIDGVHTNELGARLVAETMWEQLRPDIERWYREHP